MEKGAAGSLGLPVKLDFSGVELSPWASFEVSLVDAHPTKESRPEAQFSICTVPASRTIRVADTASKLFLLPLDFA